MTVHIAPVSSQAGHQLNCSLRRRRWRRTTLLPRRIPPGFVFGEVESLRLQTPLLGPNFQQDKLVTIPATVRGTIATYSPSSALRWHC